MRAVFGTLILATGFICGRVWAGADEVQTPNVLSEAEAVQLLRTINTAQLDLRMAKHPYASLADLLQHRFLQGANLASSIVVQDGSTGTVRGYGITVSAVANGKQYTVSLLPTERGCKVALATNESGVIYRGLPLGCERTED